MAGRAGALGLGCRLEIAPALLVKWGTEGGADQGPEILRTQPSQMPLRAGNTPAIHLLLQGKGLPSIPASCSGEKRVLRQRQRCKSGPNSPKVFPTSQLPTVAYTKRLRGSLKTHCCVKGVLETLPRCHRLQGPWQLLGVDTP